MRVVNSTQHLDQNRVLVAVDDSVIVAEDPVRKTRRMTEYLAPILRVTDAQAAVIWYQQLGFVKEWEHRFEPWLPLYVGVARGELKLHLSEHTGDARPGTLVYLYVHDLDAIAESLGVAEIDDMPWGREFEVRDPDGNRLRIGEPSVATA